VKEANAEDNQNRLDLQFEQILGASSKFYGLRIKRITQKNYKAKFVPKRKNKPPTTFHLDGSDIDTVNRFFYHVAHCIFMSSVYIVVWLNLFITAKSTKSLVQ